MVTRLHIDRLARNPGEFKDAFDSAVSHSMMDHTRLEDNAKKLADVFHDTGQEQSGRPRPGRPDHCGGQ